MYRDDIRNLIGGIDGVRTIDAQRIQIAGIAFVVTIEIFPYADMIVEQGKAGIGPDTITLQSGIDQRTVLVHIIEGNIKGRFAGSPADRDVVVLHGSRFKDVIEPIIAGLVGQCNVVFIQVIVCQAGIRGALRGTGRTI